MKSTIILVRHGKSEGNVKSADDVSFPEKANHKFSLTEKGKRQVVVAGKYIKENFPYPDTFFCSTFWRTRESLFHMFPEATPNRDSRLNELWRGIWHTMSKERILALYPEEPAIREREGEYHYRPPGGQNGPDVELGIYSFLRDLRNLNKNRTKGGTVLVSAHGNWMLLFERVVLNKLPQDFEYRYKNDRYQNGALAVYEMDGSGNIRLIAEIVPPK